MVVVLLIGNLTMLYNYFIECFLAMDIDLETVDVDVDTSTSVSESKYTSETNISIASASTSTATESFSAPKTTKGRKRANIWSLFTTEQTPQKLKSAICKHCHQRVNHHKKSEYVKSHLLKCTNFKKVMYGIPFEDRPDWFPSKRFNYGNSSMSEQGKF